MIAVLEHIKPIEGCDHLLNELNVKGCGCNHLLCSSNRLLSASLAVASGCGFSLTIMSPHADGPAMPD